jgi:hypothetical protein
LTALLEDADGNLIIGPAQFDNPVTLTTTDAVHGPVSKTTLNSPADLAGLTANYDGTNVSSIGYSASAAGLSPTNVFAADLTPGAPPQHICKSRLIAIRVPASRMP